MTTYQIRRLSPLRAEDLAGDIADCGVDQKVVPYLAEKCHSLLFRVWDVPPHVANILKQQMLSLGGEACVHRDTIT